MLGFIVMVLGPSSGNVGSAKDLDDDPVFAKVRSGERGFFPLEDPSMSRDRALQIMAVRTHAAITTNAQLRSVYIDSGILNGQMKGAALALGCQRNPKLRSLGQIRPDDTKTWSMDGKKYAITRYGNDVFFYFSSTPPKPPKLDSVQINGTSYMLNEALEQ